VSTPSYPVQRLRGAFHAPASSRSHAIPPPRVPRPLLSRKAVHQEPFGLSSPLHYEVGFYASVQFELPSGARGQLSAERCLSEKPLKDAADLRERVRSAVSAVLFLRVALFRGFSVWGCSWVWCPSAIPAYLASPLWCDRAFSKPKWSDLYRLST
jgi:hypothetical protein